MKEKTNCKDCGKEVLLTSSYLCLECPFKDGRKNKLTLTKEDILEEIRNKTHLGKELLKMECDYYMDLINVK